MGRYGYLGLCLVIVTLAADVTMARMAPGSSHVNVGEPKPLHQLEAIAAAAPIKSGEEEANIVPVSASAPGGAAGVDEKKNFIAYGGIGGFHGIGIGAGGIGKFGGIGGVAGLLPLGGIADGGLGGLGGGAVGLGGAGAGGLGGAGAAGGLGGVGAGVGGLGAHLPGVGVGAGVLPHP